eukprot:gene56655-77652_t
MIPLFLFCNLKESRLPVAFNSDAFPLLFVTVASLLNGFIANLSMIFGPKLVHPKDAALAGTIMVFCLSTGLMFGSAFSNPCFGLGNPRSVSSSLKMLTSDGGGATP